MNGSQEEGVNDHNRIDAAEIKELRLLASLHHGRTKTSPACSQCPQPLQLRSGQVSSHTARQDVGESKTLRGVLRVQIHSVTDKRDTVVRHKAVRW